MSRLSLGLTLVLLLLVSLIVAAPARLLAALLPAEQVHMEGFAGTLWRGNASRCLVRATRQSAPGICQLAVGAAIAAYPGAAADRGEPVGPAAVPKRNP